MNDTIGSMSKVFDDDDDHDDLGAGIVGSFYSITYRSGKWRINAGGGREAILSDPPGGKVPVDEIAVCLVKVPSHKSKRYWTVYDANAPKPPDCWSNDAVRPHPNATVPAQPPHWPFQQPNLCAECNWDQFGTATGQDGKPRKGKACGDYKRAVVRLYYPPVPPGFEAAEGALMLLQIPADSLQAFKAYGDELSRKRVYAHSRATYIGMVEAPGVSWPKMTFREGAEINDDEAMWVKEARKSPDTARILSEEIMLLEGYTNGNGNGHEEQEEVKTAAPAKATGFKPTPPQVQPQVRVSPTPSVAARTQAPTTQPRVTPSQPAARPVRPQPTIASAINKPAPPPPSARPVKPAPRVEEVIEEEEYGQGDAVEEAMDKAFGELPE